MRASFFTALIAAGAWPARAIACTLCDSVQAVSVRARLLQPDLWLNLGAILLPLIMLMGILAVVARDPAGRRRPK